MKTRLAVGVIVMLCAVGAWAQASGTTITQKLDASAIAPIPFAGCNGDTITITGDLTLTTTQWQDSSGDTHTRSQVVSSNLTANSTANVTYSVMYSSKTVEVVSEGITTEETLTFRMKLMGVGPLNNQQVFSEVHFTNPNGVGTGPNTNHAWSKCTG